jgi:VWFA-related protein
VRKAAVAFLDRLAPDDRTRIGNFGPEIRIAPPAFTSDREVLGQVLATDLQTLGLSSPVWTALDRSITALRTEPGRRVVLLFSDGHNETIAGQIATEVDDVIRRARYNGIMIYVIAFPYTSGRSPFAPGVTVFGQAVTTKKPHPALKEIAGETGGGYFELQPDDPLGPTFARVADELREQYWLGFAAPALDGRVHAIDVRVQRRGLTVRARRSYVADAGR